MYKNTRNTRRWAADKSRINYGEILDKAIRQSVAVLTGNAILSPKEYGSFETPHNFSQTKTRSQLASKMASGRSYFRSIGCSKELIETIPIWVLLSPRLELVLQRSREKYKKGEYVPHELLPLITFAKAKQDAPVRTAKSNTPPPPPSESMKEAFARALKKKETPH